MRVGEKGGKHSCKCKWLSVKGALGSQEKESGRERWEALL